MARPIVCVDRISLREILADGAVYFPQGEPAALAAALTRATGPDAEELAALARENVAEHTYARRAEKIIAAAAMIPRK
jgi:hypothetical protein